MKQLQVRSTVIDWQKKIMEITDTTGNKSTVSLDTSIDVVMVGHPKREEKTMLASELGQYMSRGYIIERISF
jgi:hypothetical protein